MCVLCCCEAIRLMHHADFAWCGLLIHMQDLSVIADYGRYSGTGDLFFKKKSNILTPCADLKDSLTIDKGRHPGATFVYKMLQ